MLDTRTREYVSPSDYLKHEDLDLFAFAAYVLSRWRIFAIACGSSLAVVTAVSLVLPKKYTATASILIEPPAGNDPRGSTAVSPVYLESLKTYEHFASSNSLFAQALERLNLRSGYAGLAVEDVKRRVLEVSKPRDTKVLEIHATLPDRTKARDLARYIAEQTVQINHSLDKMSLQELAEGGRFVLEQARKRLNEAKAAHDERLLKEPIAGQEADLAAAEDLKSRLRRELSDSRIELAAYEARRASQQAQTSTSTDLSTIVEGIAATKAQIGVLEKQIADLNGSTETKANLLERRRQNRELLNKELQTAQAQYETAANRNNEILASLAFRGERLEIIDPGVLPERASSPNLPLNAILAALFATLGSLLYLAISFSYRRRQMLLSYAGSTGG